MKNLRSVLAALWDSLFDINQHPARYLGRALLADLPVTLTLAFVVGLALPEKGPDFTKQPPLLLVFSLCVLSPLVETLIMRLLFWLLRFATRQTVLLVMFSTVIWAGLHSLSRPAWGLGVFWPFLIFSICYLTWETRSKRRAFWMTTALHALHNLVPTIAVVASLPG